MMNRLGLAFGEWCNHIIHVYIYMNRNVGGVN